MVLLVLTAVEEEGECNGIVGLDGIGRNGATGKRGEVPTKNWFNSWIQL